jgi:hypothetical protein
VGRCGPQPRWERAAPAPETTPSLAAAERDLEEEDGAREKEDRAPPLKQGVVWPFKWRKVNKKITKILKLRFGHSAVWTTDSWSF